MLSEQVLLSEPSGAESFSVSRDGMLVFVPPDAGSSGIVTLSWVNREGQVERVTAPARSYSNPRISPDGSEVVLEVGEENADLWIWNFGRETLTNLTLDTSPNLYPVWTPDGSRVVFSSSRTGSVTLFWKAADGSGVPEQLTDGGRNQRAHAASPDGQHVVMSDATGASGRDLFTVSLGDQTRLEPLLQSEFGETNAALSPDGRWMAYRSNESGQRQIYVRPFPNVNEGRVLVSPDVGDHPIWAPGGSELFYLAPDGRLMSVPVETGDTFQAGNGRVALETELAFPRFGGRPYDLSPDGERFLVLWA